MVWVVTIAVLLVVSALLVAAGWGLHRLCLRLEERGWMYYRNDLRVAEPYVVR